MIFKHYKKIAVLLTAIITVFAAIPFNAFAYGQVDTDRETSLTVICCYNEMPIEGIRFDLYKTADMDKYGEYTTVPEFEEYKVNFEQQDAAGWRDLALTLAAYAVRDNIQPMVTDYTDAQGRVFFSELSAGMYLVVGISYSVEGFIYTPEPFLISLPNLDHNGEWSYDVTVNCKGEGNLELDEPISLSVQKIWDDESTPALRPESISVQLLCDGEVYDTAILSEENGWYYLWSGLDPDHDWSVAEEDVPVGYTVLTSREGWAYVITNTCTEMLTELYVQKVWVDDGNEEKRPDSITVQLLCDGDVYDTVVLSEENGWRHHWTDLEQGHAWTVRETNIPTGYYAEVNENGVYYYIVNTYKPIPQTGQLWWPIPLLICVGLAFIVMGLFKGKGSSV